VTAFRNRIAVAINGVNVWNRILNSGNCTSTPTRSGQVAV